MYYWSYLLDLHPKSNLMEVFVRKLVTRHHIEVKKPAIFKNIYKHEPLAILEL